MPWPITRVIREGKQIRCKGQVLRKNTGLTTCGKLLAEFAYVVAPSRLQIKCRHCGAVTDIG